MVYGRRKGFTLIELLVVIAIIGILAGMLFPVFARAREAARKIQCLSNVKNIAMAAQMYLVDYDRFWPDGSGDPNVIKLGTDLCGWSSDCRPPCRVTAWDPYLRVPLILEEYIKNRDVWRCPSAKIENGIHGHPINPCTPDWYTAAIRDACRANGCEVYPPGWGGNLTDSAVQGMCSNDPGVTGQFQQSIATPCVIRGKTPESSHDVSKLVVCGDGGVSVEGDATYSDAYAYPDIKFPRWLLQTDGCGGHFGSGHCPDDSCGDYNTASQCTPLAMCFGGDGRLAKDASYRRTFARHLGGDNLGFADGHAKWYPADTILLGAADHTRNGIHPQLFYGICLCVNLTATPRSELPPINDPNWGDF
jgi:prepilin-type N-terminal cleavage/methylation domain-containing protein